LSRSGALGSALDGVGVLLRKNFISMRCGPFRLQVPQPVRLVPHTKSATTRRFCRSRRKCARLNI